MTARPKIAPGKLLQVVFMELVLVVGGVVLSLTTGQFAWMIAGVVAGGAVVVFMLVLPALRAARAPTKEGRLVE